jgi:hypothetical protein
MKQNADVVDANSDILGLPFQQALRRHSVAVPVGCRRTRRRYVAASTKRGAQAQQPQAPAKKLLLMRNPSFSHGLALADAGHNVQFFFAAEATYQMRKATVEVPLTSVRIRWGALRNALGLCESPSLPE